MEPIDFDLGSNTEMLEALKSTVGRTSIKDLVNELYEDIPDKIERLKNLEAWDSMSWQIADLENLDELEDFTDQE